MTVCVRGGSGPCGKVASSQDKVTAEAEEEEDGGTEELDEEELDEDPLSIATVFADAFLFPSPLI